LNYNATLIQREIRIVEKTKELLLNFYENPIITNQTQIDYINSQEFQTIGNTITS